jgi:hypothetical protein
MGDDGDSSAVRGSAGVPVATLWHRIRRMWRVRRLSLCGLSGADRALVLVALAALVPSALVIVAIGIDRQGSADDRLSVLLTWLGGDVVSLERGLTGVPAVVTIAALIGFAGGGAAFAVAALRPGARLPRLTLLGVAFCVASFTSVFKVVADTLQGLPRSDLRGNADAALTAYEALAWCGLLAAVGLAVTPLALQRRAPAVTAVLAGGPYLLGVLAYLVAGDAAHVMAEGSIIPTLPIRGYVSGIVGQEIGPVAVFSAALLLWGIAASTRGSRDVAAGVARVLGRFPRAVLAFVAAKALWVLLGLAGALPRAAGGGWDVWAHSRADGILSWAVALAFGALAAWWLAEPRRIRVGERGSAIGVLVVVLCITSGATSQVLTLSGAQISRAWSAGAAADPLDSTYAWLAGGGSTIVIVAAFVAAGLVGVRLVRRPAQRAGGVLLILFAAWSAPRLITVIGDLLSDPLARVGEGNFVEGTLRGCESCAGQRAGYVDPVTFDATLTLAVVGVVVMATVKRGRIRVSPGPLVLVLVTSSMTTYVAKLVPNDFRVGMMFYLGLIFPVAYQFLADAKELNEHTVNRRARVLAVTGIAALALAVQATQANSGDLTFERGSAADLGLGLLRAPLLLLVLAVTISAMPRTTAVESRVAT